MDEKTTHQGSAAPTNAQNEQKKEIIQNTNNEPQSPKQVGNSKKNQPNTKRIFLIVSLILASIILFFAVVFPALKYAKSLFFGPSLSEYESYLSEKYKDDTFYYVSGNPSCDWFDSGFCRTNFSSASLNGKTFIVVAYHSGSFMDTYYVTKYGFNLENFYSEKYGEPLEHAISNVTPYTARATIRNSTEYSLENDSFDSFDDYLTKLEQQDGVKAYLVLNSPDINIYNADQIDFATIESEVSKVIEQNNLKLASVNLIIMNKNSEDTGVCPKEFDHTIRISTYNSFGTEGTQDEPDGRPIDSCLRIIYSKEQ